MFSLKPGGTNCVFPCTALNRISSSEIAPVMTPASVNRNFPAGIRTRATSRNTDKRSEEHTSELQSRSDLVCRLLLEKKKKADYNKDNAEGGVALATSGARVTQRVMHAAATLLPSYRAI